MKAGNFPAADMLFTQVIAGHDVFPAPPKQAKQIGEALYDRGVTRAYQQRYDEAEADLARAVALQPERKSSRQGPLLSQCLEVIATSLLSDQPCLVALRGLAPG